MTRLATPSGVDIDRKLTLNAIHALISGLAPEPVDVEVAAFGAGISFLKKNSAEASEIAALELKHVRFVACETAMHKANLSLDLDSGIEPFRRVSSRSFVGRNRDGPISRLVGSTNQGRCDGSSPPPAAHRLRSSAAYFGCGRIIPASQ